MYKKVGLFFDLVNVFSSSGTFTSSSTWWPEEDDIIQFDGWPGGGGNLIEEGTYGGAGAHASVTVTFSVVPTTIDIIVGRKGTNDNGKRASGGTLTSLTINDTLLFKLGGGGGASRGSHGGQGGGKTLQASTTLDYFFNGGYSGSFEPFDVGSNNQVEGPTGKPTDETIQGSGAGFDVNNVSENGQHGYYGDDNSNTEGGLGGTGVGLGGSGSIDPDDGNIYGGGGGGSTKIITTNFQNTVFVVNEVKTNEAWSETGSPPWGGSSGVKNTEEPYYDLREQFFIDNQSILSTLFHEVWQVSQTRAFIDGVLKGVVRQIGGPNAILTSQNNLPDLFAPGFSEEPNAESVVESLVPITPHDGAVPLLQFRDVSPNMTLGATFYTEKIL
jgi:hypothetical protein